MSRAPAMQSEALPAMLGGLVLPARKASTAGQPIRALPLPAQVHIPLPLGEGELRLLVAPGDAVLRGQPLARIDDDLGFTCHASLSGRLLGLAPRPLPLRATSGSGLAEGLCITIASDGEDQAWPTQPDPQWRQREPELLLRRIAAAGVRGLGGAGFPAWRKLANGGIDTLILNACECEPYISADDALLRAQAAQVVAGLAVLLHLLRPRRCLIGIEDDKPEALAALQSALRELNEPRVALRVLPARYPSGAERSLIRLLTGLELPAGRLPVQEGLLCHNVGTVLAIEQAVVQGLPLIERLCTLSGEALARPGNYRIRFGTPLGHALAAAGLAPARLQRLLAGGPLMGLELPLPGVRAAPARAADSPAGDRPDACSALGESLAQLPLLAQSNCLIAATAEELPARPEPQPCIRCGHCAEVCPARLQPQLLWLHGRAGAHDKAAALDLADCIDCGACAEVCPSHLPLVAQYRASKAALREAAEECQRAEQARRRHEQRQTRLARQQEKEAARRRQLDAQASAPAPGAAALPPAIAAALARVKAKRAQGEPGGDA